jgi:hypothetical protein
MSVNFNLISTSLSDEAHAAIIDSIKGIETQIPFAITLPVEEKVALPGVGIKTVEFIDKTHEYALKNPILVPQFLDMEEYGKDTKLTTQLRTIMNHLVPLVDKINDTLALVGSEAYSSSRIFYHHVKNAARGNVPGASAVAKELGKRFKVLKPIKSSSEEEPDTPDTIEPAVESKEE